MSGWFGSDTARDQFASAAKILSPTLKVVSVDSISRMPDGRFQVWQATDIFASMSDKIQETFGMTLIEAMAAVLPIVSSGWDGYRDTVINDETEIMVPTLMAPPRDGDDLAYPNDSGADDYDHYVGTAAQFTAVDPFKVEDAFEVLMVNADKPVVDVQRRPMTGRSSSASSSSFGRSWKEGGRNRVRLRPKRPARQSALPTQTPFDLGDKTVQQAVYLAFMAHLNSTMNTLENHIAAVLHHLQEHGPTETGVLFDLVGRHARVRLRRTLVSLAKVGVLEIVW